MLNPTQKALSCKQWPSHKLVVR